MRSVCITYSPQSVLKSSRLHTSSQIMSPMPLLLSAKVTHHGDSVDSQADLVDLPPTDMMTPPARIPGSTFSTLVSAPLTNNSAVVLLSVSLTFQTRLEMDKATAHTLLVPSPALHMVSLREPMLLPSRSLLMTEGVSTHTQLAVFNGVSPIIPFHIAQTNIT